MRKIKLLIAVALLFFSNPSGNASIPQRPAYSSRSDFIQIAEQEAIKLKQKYDIPIAVTIAMAIYESRYGESSLAKKHNNFFGIKAYNWNGPVVELKTKEGSRTTTARFRSYNTLEEGFEDFGRFLQKSHYKKAFAHDDPIKFLREILRAGYCPSPTYLADIKKIIKLYDLSMYDI